MFLVCTLCSWFFFFKQKTAYEMRISDWSSDVCSSDLWSRLDNGKDDAKAELKKDRTFRLEPGMAGIFEVGQIHSIRFPDGTKFLRVTGTDLDSLPTRRFDPEKQPAAAGSSL